MLRGESMGEDSRGGDPQKWRDSQREKRHQLERQMETGRERAALQQTWAGPGLWRALIKGEQRRAEPVAPELCLSSIQSLRVCQRPSAAVTELLSRAQRHYHESLAGEPVPLRLGGEKL